MANKRLKGRNFINDLGFSADNEWIYGTVNNFTVGKWSIAEIKAGTTPTDVSGYTWGSSAFWCKYIWVIPSTGTLMAVTEEIATGYHNLWRSNSPRDIDNFTQVAQLGDTGGGQIADVELLADGLTEVDVNGSKRLYAYEYNVNSSRTLGSTNDQVRILESLDDGVTWTAKWTANTDGSTHQLKHGHGVWQNPVTKHIVFGSGDSGARGTADGGQALVVWDGVSPFPPDNTFLDEFANYPGFFSVADIVESRTVSVLFDDAGWMYTFTDASPSIEDAGIWRWSYDLSVRYQVDSQSAQFSNHTGWYGTRIGDNFYFVDDETSSTVGDFWMSLYATKTPWEAGSWEIVGRFYTEELASATVSSVFEAAGDLCVSSANLAGKSYSQTQILEITNEDWKGQIDGLAPIYWVKPTTGSDSNDGWGPGSAWRTLNHALEGSNITYGGCVMLEGSASESGFISCDWSTYSDPGSGSAVSGAPVQVRGHGRDSTVFTFSAAAVGFQFNVTNHILEIMDMALRATTASNMFDINVADCAAKLYDAKVGDKSEACRPFRPDNNNAEFHMYRSLAQADDSVQFWQPGGSITDAVFYGEASVVDGFARQIYMNNASNVTVKNCTFVDYSTACIYRESSGTLAPYVINCAFDGQASTFPTDLNLGSPAVTDKEVNFNIMDQNTDPSGEEGSNSSITDPGVDSTTYSPGTVCLGAGTSTGVKWDYYGKRYQPGSPTVGAVELAPYKSKVLGVSAMGINQDIRGDIR